MHSQTTIPALLFSSHPSEMISPRIRHCCILAVLLWGVLLPSASASGGTDESCHDPRFLRTWHDEFCCPPGGFMFELDPPNRSPPGPRCTLCPIGTHFACEEGNCCAMGTFCIRVDGQPFCSTTNVPSLFDAAPYAAPTGLLTNRTRSDAALDRHPNPRPPWSDPLWLQIFSVITISMMVCGAVGQCVLCFRAWWRKRAEACSKPDGPTPADHSAASDNGASSNSAVPATSASSSELALLSPRLLTRGSSQSRIDEETPDDAPDIAYPQINSV